MNPEKGNVNHEAAMLSSIGTFSHWEFFGEFPTQRGQTHPKFQLGHDGRMSVSSVSVLSQHRLWLQKYQWQPRLLLTVAANDT